jgi:acetyl esterase
MPESDWVAKELAIRGVTVFAVGYRLASASVKFPTPSDDLLAAYLWSIDRANEFGIERKQLALGGASAGANLAAGVSKRLRDTASQPASRLVLAYPTLHASLLKPSIDLVTKMQGIESDLLFTKEKIEKMNTFYCGDQSVLSNPYAMPGTGTLDNLPPTLILNSDLDTLRTSGERYASDLALAGNDVCLFTEPGSAHGHLNRPEHPTGRRSLERIARWIKIAS